MHESGAHQVHQVVGELAGHDLASQAVGGQAGFPRGVHGDRREVARQVAARDRVGDERPLQQAAHQVELGVREQHAQLRPGQARAGLVALEQLLPGGQMLAGAVEEAVPLKLRDELAKVVDSLAGAHDIE